MPIVYLADFYAQMRLLREVRCRLVSKIQSPSNRINADDIKDLHNIEKKLLSIPKDATCQNFRLKTHQDENISLELDYELGELQKDAIFLRQGEDALLNYLKDLHPNFKKELEAALQFLKQQNFKHFITDRDGTISNYCGRYQSSVQSIYNALFLSSFTKKIQGESIIITSAPLQNIGLADISVQPQGDFILAGSKGREFLDENGKTVTYPINKTQQDKLNQLNDALDELLNREAFSSFRYIGSGLQHKFGQTTLARQDKNNSISEKQSLKLKEEIESLLQKIDPKASYFNVEDTGKDLEIILTVDQQNHKEDFNKGHGLDFIAKKKNLKIKGQNLLICGDTASDLPMLEYANNKNARLSSIFVTTDENLKKEVNNLCRKAIIVSNPDILVTALYLNSKQ